MEGFFYVQEKNMSGEDDDYFSSIGNMYSGSYDPEEQNRAAEREAEKKRREQEKEQARLLREQQAAQAGLQKSLQQTAPKPGVLADNEPKPLPKTNPDDPLDGVPDEKRTDILLHKYDNRHPNDYSGQRLSPDRGKEYIEGWKKDVRGFSDVVRDVTLQMNMNRHPDIKEEVEKAKRQFQEWLPQPKAQTLELRLDDKDNPSNAYRTLEYRPERDGVPSIQKAIQYGNAPVKVVKADDNFLSQIMSVNVPQDESMGRAYDYLNDNAIAPMEGNESWKNNPVGHPDSSYAEAERQAGKALTGYVNKAMGRDSKIQGENKNRIVGHPDESYGNAIGSVSENMGMNSTVTGKGREVIGHPNMSYWSNWNTEESRNKPLEIVTDGVKKGASDAQILFLSGSVVVGKTLYDLFGGDPTSLQKTQKWLDDCQLEAQKRKPLELKEIYVKGDPEKTMQNVTRYMYQELGNQLVKVPAYFFLGKLESIAQLTGVSTAVMTAQLHADFRKETGESHVGESVMYAVPLGLLSGMLWPIKDAIKFKGPKEAMDYVASMVSSVAVHKVRDINKNMVVNRIKSQKSEQEDE